MRRCALYLAPMTPPYLLQDPEVVEREKETSNNHDGASDDGCDFGCDGPGAALLGVDVDERGDEACEGVEAAGPVDFSVLARFMMERTGDIYIAECVQEDLV
jgi:hypothetical protein